jgi:CubicO group peptidase (beta-lactamase class C family)
VLDGRANIGKMQYLPVGNLVSYIILERTGKTPEQFMKEKVFPLLGITEDDYKWDYNKDKVSLGFHGLHMTARALSKLGMLYLQRGMANKNDRLISEEWVNATFTVHGNSSEMGPSGYLMWWPDGTPVVCSGGLGGQQLCLNFDTNRVIAVLADVEDDAMDVFTLNIFSGRDGASQLFISAFMGEPKMRVVCGGENDGTYYCADGNNDTATCSRASATYSMISLLLAVTGTLAAFHFL